MAFLLNFSSLQQSWHVMLINMQVYSEKAEIQLENQIKANIIHMHSNIMFVLNIRTSTVILPLNLYTIQTSSSLYIFEYKLWFRL